MAEAGTMTTTDPRDEVLDLELPAELGPIPGQEPAEPGTTAATTAAVTEPAADKTAAAEPAKPAAEAPAAKPAPTERPARPARQRLGETVDQLRTQYHAAVASARAAEKPAEPVDFNKLGDLNEVAGHLRAESQAALRQVEQRFTATKVTLSERYFRQLHPHYDQKLETSGVAEAFKIDPATKTFTDPFLVQLIYSQADPAAFAYNLALERLGEAPEDGAPEAGATSAAAVVTTEPAAAAKPAAATNGVPAERVAAREAVDRTLKNAARPVGIAGLPSSGSPRPSLTVADIARMSDPQKLWIKKNRPDVWEKYLGKPD